MLLFAFTFIMACGFRSCLYSTVTNKVKNKKVQLMGLLCDLHGILMILLFSNFAKWAKWITGTDKCWASVPPDVCYFCHSLTSWRSVLYRTSVCTCTRLGIYFCQKVKLNMQIEAPGSAWSRLIHSISAPSTTGGIAGAATLAFAVLICHNVWKKSKCYIPTR